MGGYQERRRCSRVLAAWVWAYYLTPVGPGSSVFKWKGQQYSLDHRKSRWEGGPWDAGVRGGARSVGARAGGVRQGARFSRASSSRPTAVPLPKAARRNGGGL